MAEPASSSATWRRRIAAMAVTLAASAHATPAAAVDKDPLDYSLRQYGIVLVFALLGGLVSWVSKVRSGRVRGFQMLHLVGELATSALAGLLMFYFCEWLGLPKLLTICLVGVFGHMGTRGIALFEEWAERRFHGLADDPGGPR